MSFDDEILAIQGGKKIPGFASAFLQRAMFQQLYQVTIVEPAAKVRFTTRLLQIVRDPLNDLIGFLSTVAILDIVQILDADVHDGMTLTTGKMRDFSFQGTHEFCLGG